MQGSLAAGLPARDVLVSWRTNGLLRLRARLRQAIDEGDLPPGSDPGRLARYVSTVTNGFAVQAATGAGHDDLQQVADMVLATWPSA